MATIFDEFLKARGAGEASNARALQGMHGVLQMQQLARQSAMEEQMQPLKLQQLQQAVAQAQHNAQLRGVLQAQLTGGGQGGAVTPQGALTAGAAQGDVGPTASNAARIGAPGGVLSPGGLPGVNPMAAALLLSGDAGMGRLGTAMQEANKPIAAREGAPVINPQTGQILFYAPKLDTGMMPSFQGGQITGVSNIPGFVPAMTERTRATEEVKADSEILQLPGQPLTTRGAQLRQLNAPPAPQAPLINEDGAPSTRPLAEQQQIRALLDQGNATPRQPTPYRVPTPAETAGATAVAKERAEGGVKFEQSVLDAGRSARSNLTSLQMIAPDLSKMPTGPLYPTLVNLQNYMQQFGLKVDPMLGPAQATDAILKQFALKLRDPSGGGGMPGALSDQDRQFLVDMLPGLAKSPQGNRTLVKVLMSIEQRKIDEASIVNKMQAAKFGTNDIREALGQYASQNSITAGLR